EHGGNCVRDDSDVSVRYIQNDAPTADAFSDAAEADIAYLRKSVRLLTDDQPRASYVTIPLARLRRSSSGAFEHDSAFVPPSINLHACPGLLAQLRSLLDALQAKAEALYGLHREPS